MGRRLLSCRRVSASAQGALAALFVASAASLSHAQTIGPSITDTVQGEPDGASSQQDLRPGPATSLTPTLPMLQAQSDAWWTGPMLAASAETLPRGHVLFEPYFFDVHGDGKNDVGTLNYLLYGVTDRFSAGLILTGGDVISREGIGRSQPQLGDLTLIGQFRLTHFTPSRPIPTISLILQQTLPTGRFDRLGATTGAALGSGGSATTVGLYAQTYLWLPNGRILRPRLDLLETLPHRIGLHDQSVYGTPAGFEGAASVRSSFVADAALEYSVTRRWVWAVDLVYRQTGSTAVHGEAPIGSAAIAEPYFNVLEASRGMSLAPAIEYNFSSALGVLLGVRVTPASRNTASSVTPAIAINWVR